MFLERDEMKFAVLYTLKRYVEPASMGQLTEILTWEKEVMGYFELAIWATTAAWPCTASMH